MNGEDHSSWLMAPPPMAPLNMEREEHWRRFDNSVNAVSFGFVATAILISMFLVMAIFERFLRPRSSMPPGPSSASDLEAQMMFNGKLNYPSPKVCFLSLSYIENRNYFFSFCFLPLMAAAASTEILLSFLQHHFLYYRQMQWVHF